MLLETHSGPYSVQLLYEGNNMPCMLTIKHVTAGVTVVEDLFPNARMLSAQLRDTLGMSDAIAVLNHWCISPNSDLWDLNHSRPYPRMAADARDDDYHDELFKPDEDYILLSSTGWSTYDSGERYYLYEHLPSGKLFYGVTGANCMVAGTYYDHELEPISIEKWAGYVKEFDQLAEGHSGY